MAFYIIIYGCRCDFGFITFIIYEQRAIAYSREEMEEESEWEDEEAERVEKDAFSIFKDFDDEEE